MVSRREVMVITREVPSESIIECKTRSNFVRILRIDTPTLDNSSKL